MTSFPTIGFIGAGNLGRALGKRLQAADQTVIYWDVDKKLATANSLDDLARSSQLILICTPSPTNRLIAREIAQAVGNEPAPTVISLAKGTESNITTMDQVLAAELGNRYVTGVISGPMLATEIANGSISGAIVATNNPEQSVAVAKLINLAGIITEPSADPTGVARCGALKNVFALILGLSDGLKLSFNTKSVLTTLALTEFRHALEHFGSSPDLAFTLAGIGDLLTTGWSGVSFNWEIGRRRGQGEIVAKGEGVNTLRQLAAVMPLHDFTLIHAASSIFFQGADPASLREILSSYTAQSNP